MLKSKLLLILIAPVLPGQAPHVPEFAVSSVRPNQVGNSGGKEGFEEKITVTPASVIMYNVTLRSCVRWAYDLRDYQVFAPSWLASQHYDITAKPSAEASVPEMRLMMRRLLADRFRLIVRQEAKELPAYAMTVSPSSRKRERFKSSTGGEQSMKFSGGSIEFHAYSMADLAERLGSRPFKLDRLVVDKTGLEGTYDFKLEVAEDVRGMKLAFEGMEQNSPGSPSILTFLQDQLGLVFKAQKAPVESLIVVSGERVPTGN